ncbi:MAG: chorismate mutase [Candidatus Micrarchaeota archaeon]|nr:chorismate mutase [Candidatus Micrarchaeota archaeon]MDE1834235.1 chorismate mutase [Candidatus Micrarchaeota archaeon]MDE1859294.1 chorismate mutase [Candidatus Micrarchaeota archaeon]
MGSEDVIRQNREVLDGITQSLVRLIAQRDKAVLKIGKAKNELGIKIIDASRERKLLEKGRRLAKRHNVNPETVARILKILIKHSRYMQAMKKRNLSAK